MTKPKLTLKIAAIALFLMGGKQVFSQTDQDGIMMNKYQFCNGFVYTHSSWDHYWEGTLKRTNENLGTVTTQSVMYMANYGITNNLNVMVGAPYIFTKASAGTLHGLKGVQDLSLLVKYRAIKASFGKSKLSLFAVGGFSTPLTNYVTDLQPLSIGLGSTNLSIRGLIDYQYKRLFATGSAAYIRRSNIRLDRDAYYDTEFHLTNEVKMPDAATYQLRVGYRGKYLIGEAMVTNFTTLGGFDITRNNMPFPSNKMNATMVGAGFKYTIPTLVNLSLLGSYNYTVAGRNMGQASAFSVGAFYAFYFKKKQNPSSPVQNK